MAVDTANKRFSVMRLGQSVGLLPAPDGAIGTADRAHLLGLYAGIALDAPAEVVIAFLVAEFALEPVLAGDTSMQPVIAGEVSLNG